MKKPIRYTLALLAASLTLPATGLFAQTAAPTSTPSVSVPPAADPATPTATPGKHGGKMRERLAVLTPEERQKLKAAHEKALQDPAVKTAETTRATDKKSYHKALKEAMLRADPSVGPILEKLRANRPGKKKNL